MKCKLLAAGVQKTTRISPAFEVRLKSSKEALACERSEKDAERMVEGLEASKL